MAASNKVRVRAAAAVAGGLVALLAASPASAGTINVANNADSGPGSLRQAVIDANPNDTIVVPAGTYVLNSVIIIDKKVEITGAGAGSTTIDASGNAPHRIFNL